MNNYDQIMNVLNGATDRVWRETERYNAEAHHRRAMQIADLIRENETSVEALVNIFMERMPYPYVHRVRANMKNINQFMKDRMPGWTARMEEGGCGVRREVVYYDNLRKGLMIEILSTDVLPQYVN